MTATDPAAAPERAAPVLRVEPTRTPRARTWAHVRRYRFLYLLMVPALAYVVIYKYGPDRKSVV